MMMAILARSMRADRLRLYLIVVLVGAAVLSVAGKKADSPFVGWLASPSSSARSRST